MASNLNVGFHRLGVDAEVVLNASHAFRYDEEYHVSGIVRVWQKLFSIRKHFSDGGRIKRQVAKWLYIGWSVLVLFWALFRFDAFIFFYGHTITNRELELKLIKFFAKKIIFIYVGSDTRPPYIDGPQFPVSAPVDFNRLALATRIAKQKVTLQESYADFCINSPSSAQFHTKPFVNWFKAGIPKALSMREVDESQRENGRVRILHSPSYPEIKGSVDIIAAIERLKRRGYLIDLVKIEGMPNAAVMNELALCDFVVDQLYSDTPMAAFATEAAHFGKPAVVAGYFSRDMHLYLSEEDIPPSLFVMPNEIEGAIERLVVDKDFRQELGGKAQEFVSKKWEPELVAQRFLDLIEGKIKNDWWLDPQAIRYVQGCGMPEAHAKHLVKGLIERYGIEALQLSDKPELERAFAEFAALNSENLQ